MDLTNYPVFCISCSCLISPLGVGYVDCIDAQSKHQITFMHVHFSSGLCHVHSPVGADCHTCPCTVSSRCTSLCICNIEILLSHSPQHAGNLRSTNPSCGKHRFEFNLMSSQRQQSKHNRQEAPLQ